MSLGQLSKNHIKQTAADWEVPKDHWDPLFRYLVNGFDPGGFWSAVLSNDWFKAIQRSHPRNDIQSLKSASAWIQASWPRSSWGSSEIVDQWLRLTDDERRQHLENVGLAYDPKKEVELILRGTEIKEEPQLW